MKTVRKLLAAVRKADFDFGLIEEGDNIMIGVSGGKDSICLLYLLHLYQKFADKNFTFKGIMLDLGFPHQDLTPLYDFVNKYNIPFEIVDSSDVYQILVQHKVGDHLPCSICSRMKKASINKVANEQGYKKVSFAHHADDAIETLLMNMTHGGRLATFSPKMHLEKADIEFIRPLIYAREKDVSALVKELDLPVIKSTCSNDQSSERAVFKQILLNHYKRFPDSHDNFLTMLTNTERFNLWFKSLGNSDGAGVFIKKIRSADDMARAMKIRSDVFLVEQQIDPKLEFDEIDFTTTHYLISLFDIPIGTLRVIIDEPDHYHLGRVAILKEYRGKGYGRKLLSYVEKKLSQIHTPLSIEITAQVQALAFYRRLGYQEYGEVFIEAGIPHMNMNKRIDKPIFDKARSKH